MFAQGLDATLAYDIATALMDGFNRHYRLFRTESARAKHGFETADWHAQQRAQRERTEFYDLRVLTLWSTWKSPRPMCSSCAA